MPSDNPTPRTSSRWQWLRSQGLGVACGLGTVVLLAAGSIVMAATRAGASAKIRMDDIRVFFESPAATHAWFYALVPLLTLYGLNTFLATWHSIVTKWRNGARRPADYAATIIHASFLVALVAHLVGGVWGTDYPPLVLDSRAKALPNGGQARLVSLETESMPNGMPKSATGHLEFIDAKGGVEKVTIGYNAPVTSGLGSNLLLLVQTARFPGAARLAVGSASEVVPLGEWRTIAGYRLRVDELRPMDRRRMKFAVRLSIENAAGPRILWLLPGVAKALDPETPITLQRIEASPAVMVRPRYAPGNPIALLAAVLLTLGVVLMWRRFLPPLRRP